MHSVRFIQMVFDAMNVGYKINGHCSWWTMRLKNKASRRDANCREQNK